MKKIDLGQIVTIFANIGVIVGIAFLAVEINQGNRLARLQMRNDIAETTVALSFNGVSTDIARLIVRARDLGSLTPEEQVMLDRLMDGVWRHRENIYYQYQNGLFDESEFLGESASWTGVFNSPMGRDHYCQVRQYYSEGFIEVVESMLATTECPSSELARWAE